MAHLVAREPWGNVDLDTMSGRVYVQEDWFYQWILGPGATGSWTYTQKRTFHTRMDRQIWGVWSNRVTLTASGNTELARRLGGAPMPVNFDIRWRTQQPAHWTVNVRKMPAGASPTAYVSHVLPVQRIINLDSGDVHSYAATNKAGAQSTRPFLPGPHEFGHTVGAPGSYLLDEYQTGSPSLSDTESIMNVGRELRQRHVQAVIVALQRLAPGTSFRSNLPA